MSPKGGRPEHDEGTREWGRAQMNVELAGLPIPPILTSTQLMIGIMNKIYVTVRKE